VPQSVVATEISAVIIDAATEEDTVNITKSVPAGPFVQQLHANVEQLLEIELQAERERSRSKEALIHAAKMAAIGRMVVGVNHEIKRPLASMRLLAENSSQLLARGDGQLVADNLHMLVRIMDQLDQLSRQLEGFSRKTPMKNEVVSVRDIVACASAVLAPQLQTGRGKVKAQVSEYCVYGDRDRLMLVLVNLMANGLEAMSDCATREIEIDTVVDNHDLVINVRDHGPGLNATALEHLFEPFYTTKPAGKGLGLGLALSAEVVAEMGGELRGDNHSGGGAQFSIRLPRA
jgi:C4-dicarboxylate-specific signal transduction histidine kinase